MKATRQAARRRPRRRGLVTGTALAMVATVLLVSLIVVLRSGRDAGTGNAAATPVAGSQETAAPPVASERKPPTASPAATAGATTPAPSATTAPARTPPATTRQPASGTASLAGRIRPETTYRGTATHYDAGTGDGACLYGPSDDRMTAAMNHTDYESAKACGAYVRVRAAGGASVTVRITNECPLPCAPGQLDLSAQAFAELAASSLGRIPVTWSLLSPSTSDTVSIRYKTGSSRWWCAIQVIGHRNPVARLEVRTGDGWHQLPRTDYNYFLSDQGSGCGGAIRITDIYGEPLVLNGIALRPDAVQPTRVQFAQH
ncbi:expansin EXLX1 family cellulose-binding protein [Streptomyces mirabilis]|uniref:expansin EXLX1 family cellulose-binding protein n=1 Tax=Streptomyces mirabilis TaxID=68239 RepID=UPI00362EEC96